VPALAVGMALFNSNPAQRTGLNSFEARVAGVGVYGRLFYGGVILNRNGQGCRAAKAARNDGACFVVLALF